MTRSFDIRQRLEGLDPRDTEDVYSVLIDLARLVEELEDRVQSLDRRNEGDYT